MTPKNIPQDINIELLLSYYSEHEFKVHFDGLHKRNVYHDLVEIVENDEKTFELTIGRNSLYHILPQYMFHPFDRFKDVSKAGGKDAFQKAFDEQKAEAENAQKLFEPLDLLLLLLKKDLWQKTIDYVDTNKVIIDLIGDRLTEEQKRNRFIRQFIPLLPSCKDIRGNKTMLTLLLRNVFLNEELQIEPKSIEQEFTDIDPEYQERLSGEIGALYLGNKFHEQVTVYTIHYWSEDECNENFLKFIKEIEELRDFIQDYFIALDEIVRFEITTDAGPLRLSDHRNYNYLNYNTNL